MKTDYAFEMCNQWYLKIKSYVLFKADEETSGL